MFVPNVKYTLQTTYDSCPLDTTGLKPFWAQNIQITTGKLYANTVAEGYYFNKQG